MAGGFPGASTFDPLVNFLFFEFPETTDLVSRHVFVADPLVGSVALDAQIFGYFVNREPPVFHD